MASQMQKHLMLLCLLTHAKQILTSLPLRGAGNDVSWASEALLSLMSGPCQETHILLVMDEESEHFVPLVEVLAIVENRLLSTQIMRQQSLLETHPHLPVHHVRGDLITAILILRELPYTFLQHLDSNIEWNPKYLVLICLDEQLNTTSLLSFPVIQRSEFIFLLQRSVKQKRRIGAFTSFPLQADSKGKGRLRSSLGVWTPDRFATRESVFSGRFESFGGYMVQLSSWCDDTPLMYLNKNGICVGQNLDALDIMGNKYNFTYNVQMKPEDEQWGTKENGSWVGLLGGLKHGGKDLTINGLLLNTNTSQEFDFAYPYQAEGYAFLVILPPPLPNWRRLLYPFTGEVWGAVLAAVLLAPSLLCLLVRWFNPTQDVINLALNIGAGLLKQSVNVSQLKAWWSRVWLGWWWIAAFILCSVYTGNLVAVLTVPVYPKLISTVEELAESSLRVSMLDYGTFVPDALRVSNHSALSVLGKKMDLEPYDDDTYYDSVMEKVKAGVHVLLEAFSYLIYVQNSYNMTYTSYIMPDQIYTNYMTWFLPRNTPYTSIISDALTSLKETGVMARLTSTHRARRAKERDAPRGGKILSLPQLHGPFLLWLLCCAAACLIFSLEWLTYLTI